MITPHSIAVRGTVGINLLKKGKYTANNSRIVERPKAPIKKDFEAASCQNRVYGSGEY